MKFSENWLRSHVPTSASRDDLAATLTAIGLEVEDVTALGDGLAGVVVARIVEAVKHPEADRLQVCKVDIGRGEPLQIVCGAPNARAGLVAPLATVGSNIGGIAIKAAKLRGVESNGMLCSARELGLDADASGLLELPDDAPVGTPLVEYLGLPDASIEIKLTPNRADCFSVRGIAYDVAAALASEVLPLDVAEVPAATARALEVKLQAGADAPRFVGRVVEGVDPTAKTPVWMAERLRRAGVRPVSLLVDITQYVMLELGQPMHAYDLDKLDGAIGVRHSRAGETLPLLNGQEAKLDDGAFLVICDGQGGDRAIGLAGIMGGESTKVGDATRNVFLEAAHFAPAAIMGRSRRLGLHTDASHRFERGVDPELPRVAIEYATRLVMQLAGGTPGPVTEAVLPEHLPQPATILLRRARIARVLGVAIADAEVERILRALGMEVVATADGWQVTAPSRRFDIAIEEDLIEELARIHGYDRIPATVPGGPARIAAPSESRVAESDLRRQMVARDYLEAVSFAFVEAALLEKWHSSAGTVPLANPLSAELAVMRPRLLPGLVDALARNAARQAGRVRLFELGRVFAAPAAGETAPLETRRIAAVACGDAAAEQWGLAARKVDFHDLKGDLESLAAVAGAKLEFRPSAEPFGHPGRSADVFRTDLEGGEVRLGWIGQLHPRLARALDLDVEVVGFELDLEPLQPRALPRAEALSRFPAVRRDLAFVVAEQVAWSALAASVREAAGPVLRDLLLFDRYQGPGVESGCKSLAMGLILQDNTRTLTDQDADAVVERVVAGLGRDHGARIRG
ncbi:phenylalanine--tRNA ligase subunit beta [Pseudoxanthomonas sp. J35]|uniref:phenylalanine--tRNA ligase subunit beta n=1 Tax=Pseudoxanthomonas sp. J35 TaxID=935852 RepID=UPI00048E65BD|nr:phenylalanine--tRNA ligase subunit beta [Pseudoxanthomonas sp. J35]